MHRPAVPRSWVAVDRSPVRLLTRRTPNIFHIKDAELAVLICYESIYLDFGRRAANKGADILVNIKSGCGLSWGQG